MWLLMIYVTAPVTAVFDLLMKTPDTTECIESDNADTQSSVDDIEPMPEYDDPYLRADHPFWEGNPPADVVAGRYTWAPPWPIDIPSVPKGCQAALHRSVLREVSTFSL
ncbi:hypothetical protein VP1G_10808 [Cytospora mali]|uniref:Uncharacterized protein n=1 Tax=Cytospora mali TaxID=578113 RepID=A0A194UXH4_CYTMA|nr:hypothetical protein VP1G_10808 [Valsa mali var. pyri (nom. inval.)]